MDWINVSDELPPEMEKVLVYIIGDADPEIVVSYWDEKADTPDEEGFLFVRWHYGDMPMYSTSWYQKVTHWAKLPVGPK